MMRGGQEEKVVFIRCLVSGTEKICLECGGLKRLLFVCLASGIEPRVACILGQRCAAELHQTSSLETPFLMTSAPVKCSSLIIFY